MIDVAADRHLLLIGRPPLAEYLGFLATQTLEGDHTDHGELAEEWRRANDHVGELSRTEARIADNPVIGPIPNALRSLAHELSTDTGFSRSFSIVPTSIGLVELDKLVVLQKHLNLSYVDQLCLKLGASPSQQDIFSCCLPEDPPAPPTIESRVAQNAFVFVSPSTDFRLLEVKHFAPPQLPESHSAGRVTGMVGLVIGYGANYFNVLHCEGRLVLNNGNHRAYALRKLGVTHVPCVIQGISRREELDVVGGGDIASRPDVYLGGSRPPLLKDYFDARLRKLVSVTRQVRQMRITFAVETLDVPVSQP